MRAVRSEEEVVPAAEVKAMYRQIRERLLGKKTQENKILREAAEVRSAVGAIRLRECARHWVYRAAA